jgi:hypothetical protein
MKVQIVKKIILITLVCNSVYAFSGNGDSTSVKLKFKGFIKADAIFDSRQSVSARESFVLMYPKSPLYDRNGKDINSRPQYNQFATSSRLIFTIDTLRLKKSFVTAYFETDFTGASEATNSGLRLRHGYLKIENSHYQLLVGQYWHPLVAPEAFPDMLSLNLGNPIKSAMRAPQVRFQYNLSSFRFIGVASVHRDNSAIGPIGIVPDYLKNQIIPALHFQSIFSKGNFLIGAGVDYKRLRIRNSTNDTILTNELVYSTAVHLFTKIEFKKFTIKGQWIWGQNLYDQAMLGGLGVSNIDPLTKVYSYTPIAQTSAWLNIATKFPKFNFSIFAGYAQNLGAEKPIVGTIYARGSDILYIYRIAPQFSYKVGKVILFSETELTTAAYGSSNQYDIVKNTKEFMNIRENLSILFLF